MGFFDFLKPKNQRFDMNRYTLADGNARIFQDLMADPEGSNMFFRTYELLGYDPCIESVRNDPILRQRVGKLFSEIANLAIIAKLSPTGVNVIATSDLDFKITVESCSSNEVTELYRSYIKQLFKIQVKHLS